ncbi:MAG TPA: GNAT family N-acetyltransferase [Aggregatilineaceae bacterium]|nr:GNAT family N-acetyltransferase [Aggregatilineaceae bacterium]
MIDSGSLTIRGLHTDDWENLYPLLHQDEVLRNSTELPYTPEDGFRERFNNPPATLHTLIAETGQPSGRKRIIGTAWLTQLENRRRHCGELTVVVYPEYQNADVEHMLLQAALELADQWLGLHRVDVLVYADQTATIEFYGQHGFKLEATMRQYAFRNGSLQDAALLARIRPDIGSEEK